MIAEAGTTLLLLCIKYGTSRERRNMDLEKPITTQEDLDSILENDRTEQAKKYEGWSSPEDVAKKYEGWISPSAAKKQTDTLQSQIDGLTEQAAKDTQRYADLDKQFKAEQAKSHGFEIRLMKQKAALEAGLDPQLADRLSGDNEKDIKKDAEALKKLTGASSHSAPPLTNWSSGTQAEIDRKAAYKTMLSQLRGE